MPTKRTPRTHSRIALGPLEVEHLQSGSDHLLSGDCRLCRIGIESARSTWAENREAVLFDWNRLAFPFPCLAQVLFDGERFPPERNPAWRDLHKWTWTMIADELAALAPFQRPQPGRR